MKKTAVCIAITLCMGLFTGCQNYNKEAQWIAMEPTDTLIVPGAHGGEGINREVGRYKMPMFLRDFDVKNEVESATARVCGLGHFEFYLNGQKVGNHFLDPGWTCYDKEALYVEFDVKDYLQQGDNQISVMLGNGFYNIPNERYYKLVCSYGAPKLWMEMEVIYKNGKHERIVTDCEKWKVCQSPITYSSIFGGETYDARRLDSLEMTKPIPSPIDIRLMPQKGTELVVRCEVPEKSHFQDAEGTWIYDLGQNFSGIVRMKVKGARGCEVQLWPAELIDERKCITQGHSGEPYHWDYILAGTGEEERWQPQFTYYGQRYIKVVGAVPAGTDNPDNLPEISELTGLHTCTASEEVGSFECGDTLFNRIHTLIDWAIRSNSQSVFTDCPHREKLGWMEQDHLMQHSIQYRYNVMELYRKIFNDMEASQWENGCIPTIAPMYVMFAGGFEDTPEWGSAYIVSQWQAYRWYGDQSTIEAHYPSMQRYIDYLGTRADNHIVAYGLGDWYDIGPGAPGFSQLTSNGLTATAIYYYDVVLMARMATLLGKNDDASRYSQLAEEIKAAFNAQFYHEETGSYDRGSQTANAMPLYVGLVEEKNKGKVLQSLINDIKGRDYALTAGDVGYRFVLQALQEAGRSDIIYRMNRRDDVPGYGWQLAHGATSLTESWQAYTSVSNNHLMLGHLMEWLYGGLCGLRQTEESAGFEHLHIQPQIIPEIGSAKGSLMTGYGKVVCAWQISNGKLSVNVEVPAGCDAHILIPEYGIDQYVEKDEAKAQTITLEK